MSLRREQAQARADGPATSASAWRWRSIPPSPTWATWPPRSTRSSGPSRSISPKSGAVDAATVKIDPLGRVIAILGTTPQGQGHQTIVSQIVADELGLEPRDVTVVDEMDTFTRVWSISSGTYSSRFGSVGTSAVALAARKLKAKLVEYAAHLMDRAGRRRRVSRRRRAPQARQGRRPTPSRTWPGARTGTPSRCPTAWSPGCRPPPCSASRWPRPWTPRTA